MRCLWLCAIAVVVLSGYVQPHGRLILPAARNCMWRFGYPNPINYDDAGLYCGGFDRQWHKNKGRCGVCGDPFDAPQLHADGGKYSNGIIAKTYKKGQVIDVNVQITVSHKGYFMFRVGDFSNSKTEGDYAGKLKGEILKFVEGGDPKDNTRSPIIVKKITYKFKLQLPANLTCKRCVLQWWYRAGNNWGCDPDGKCGSGKGPQDTTVNCADIKIE